MFVGWVTEFLTHVRPMYPHIKAVWLANDQVQLLQLQVHVDCLEPALDFIQNLLIPCKMILFWLHFLNYKKKVKKNK